MKLAGVLHLNKSTKLFNFLSHKGYALSQTKWKNQVWKERPRQDSNLESSDPKSDALSIRPRGRRSVHWILLLFHNQLYYKYAL